MHTVASLYTTSLNVMSLDMVHPLFRDAESQHAQSRMQLLSFVNLAWTQIYASIAQDLLFLFNIFLAQSP